MKRDDMTKAQLAAIETSCGEILVSASAGSGKTTVMLERVLRLLADGAKLSEMIVCTFTKAAAADMRAKFAERLGGEAAAGNAWAVAALEQLPLAEISTIDSFFARLCRNYFYYSDEIDPAFEVLEQTAAFSLLLESVGEAVSARAESGDPVFLQLYEILTPGRRDDKLTEIVCRLYEFASIHPDPAGWLDRAAEKASDHAAHLAFLADYYAARIPAFLARGRALIAAADVIGFSACAESLEKFCRDVSSGLPIAPRITCKASDSAAIELLDAYKKLRADYQDFCADRREAELSADPAYTQEHLDVLIGLVRDASALYRAKKRKKAAADFNDIEHAAYKILADDAAAEIIAQTYRYLFVDEFQDVNPLQDAIFNRFQVKRFYVGDVKQSIYGFRLSAPEIFIDRYRAYRIAGTDGDKLTVELNTNHRSDSGVLRFCDKVFSESMTHDFGGVDYADGAQFISGKGSLFTPPIVCTPLYDGQADADRESAEDAEEADAAVKKIYSVQYHDYAADTDGSAAKREALAVAAHIRRLKTAEIPDGKGKARPVVYRDIAVLLRAPGTFSDILCDTLRASGIPVKLKKETAPSENPAVASLLHYLSLIDNRRDDIALASVLKSAFGGFCSDAELAAIRARADKAHGEEKLSFFRAAELAASEASASDATAQKLNRLFAELSRYETLSRVLDVGGLAGRICADYAFFKYAYAMPDGKSIADGLSHFLDKLGDLPTGSDLGGALASLRTGAVRITASGDADAVQVMTVHAAKGLEFPFVILANLSKAFNFSDLKEDCALNAELGAALKFFDAENRAVVKTSLWHRVKLVTQKKQLEEEMRILYVALTRAQYQTALFASVGKNFVPKTGMDVTSALDWLYAPMLAYADTRQEFNAQPSAPVRTRILFSPPEPLAVGAITAYTAYQYPGQDETPLKISATRRARQKDGQDAPRVYTPFLQAKDIAGADVGDAYHKFLETFDYTASCEEGLARFQKEYPFYAPLLKEKTASNAVMRLKERIGTRKFYREQPFLFREEKGGLIQGIVDLLIESADGIEIVDYKTGKVTPELRAAYEKQLGIYALAAERILKKRVLKSSVFLISEGEFIESGGTDA